MLELRRPIRFLLAVCLFGPPGFGGTAAAAQFSCGQIPNFDVAVSLAPFSTDLTTFQNISNTRVEFKQPGKSPGCALVRFSARATTSDINVPNISMLVRPLLDGGTLAVPSEAQLTSDDNENNSANIETRAHSFEFVFTGVSPGAHAIVMQMRRNSSAVGRVFVSESTTIVAHP